MTLRIAIVVGHHPEVPGVKLADGTTEHDFNRRLAVGLWQELYQLTIGAKVYTRQEPSYSRGEPELVKQINDDVPDLVLALHSNGFSSPKATGSECLHWPVSVDQVDRPGVRPRGDRYLEDAAARIAEAYSACIGIRNRGTVAQSHSWNEKEPTYHNGERIPGGPVLYILRDCPAVIGESHFMTAPKDHAKAVAALDDGSLPHALAAALAAAVEDRRHAHA